MNDKTRLVQTAFQLYEGHGGELLVSTVMVRSVRTILAYRFDRGEHERRQRVGLTAVTRLDWLDCLMHLPVGMPVQLEALTVSQWQIVRQLPRGCLRASAREIVREIVRPLCVDAALIVSSDWRTGLRDARSFSSYCTRILAVAGMPADLPEAEAEADYHGIGLVVSANTEPVLIVHPEIFTADSQTAAGWGFSEHAYRGVVMSGRA